MKQGTPIIGIALCVLLLSIGSHAGAKKKTPVAAPESAPAVVIVPVEPAPLPVVTPAEPTGSLWGSNCASAVFTSRPHGVGDILTVNVFQQSVASTTAKHSTQKDFSATAGPGTGLFGGFSGFGAKATRSTDGSGNSSSSTRIVDYLTVTVTQMLPNGNLVISGNRVIQIEKDEMTLTFSGVVDPRDIGSDNTISSTLVANQQLIARGCGPIAEKQRPGVLSRLLSFLW